MKKVGPVLLVSAVLIVGVVLWAPHEWMWPAVGAIAGIAIFVTTRVLSMVITDEAEKHFNKKR